MASLRAPRIPVSFVRPMDDPVVVFSTKKQLPPPGDLDYLFVPIISIDHLSQDYRTSHVDNILALQDQALLLNSSFIPEQEKHWLFQPITENPILGGVFNHFHGILNSLAMRSSQCQGCEVLLYLSGHGTNPDNLHRVPRDRKPHPARFKDAKKDEEDYLEGFYKACATVFGAHCGQALGFVGGEVTCHRHGYTGVLGVLGLWCFANRGQVNRYVQHHLVIVADCCYSGVWGATLASIMSSASPCLSEYRDLLRQHPVSIQCATGINEASYGGVFTPLWCFLNDNRQVVQRYLHDFNPGRSQPPHADPVQQPWYVSTSHYRPSYQCFDNPKLFAYLHHRKLMELQDGMQRNAGQFSPLVNPSVVAMARFSSADHVRCILKPCSREYVSTSHSQPSLKCVDDTDSFAYLHHMEFQNDMQRNDGQFSPPVNPSVVAMRRVSPERSCDDRASWCILL